MNFASALFSLKRGFKIKRKDWIGYWQLEGDSIMIHCKDGRVFNLVDSEDIIFTIEQMACDDWEVVTTVDNVGLPHNPEVKKDNRDMSIPVKKYYPKFISDNNRWWEHQPSCLDKKYESSFCVFDGYKWSPHKLTEEDDHNINIADYKLCYNYEGEWVPWDKLEAKMLENETSKAATSKKPFDLKTVNAGDIISDSSKFKIESTPGCCISLNNIK